MLLNDEMNEWRNLRRHIKKKHEIQDDTLSDMVDRAELVIQNWELQNIILLTKGLPE